MREYLEKLLSLLEHKYAVLDELIACQEAFKRFLIKPDWPRFLEVTLPQEPLLNRLRQVQSAQDYLMAELAKRLRLCGKLTLRGLCACLEPEWQRSLLAGAEKIKDAVAKLRQLSRLSQVLHQAQWRFLRQAEESAASCSSQLSVYTPQGYTRQACPENRFVREV